MKKSSFCRLVAVISVFFLLAVTRVPGAAAFSVPERLIYDLTWTGIKAGTATLEIVRDGNWLRIISTARSADWISIFYTVDDRTESVLMLPRLPALVGFPENYHMKIREGRHRRDKEVTFDQTSILPSM